MRRAGRPLVARPLLFEAERALLNRLGITSNRSSRQTMIETFPNLASPRRRPGWCVSLRDDLPSGLGLLRRPSRRNMSGYARAERWMLERVRHDGRSIAVLPRRREPSVFLVVTRWSAWPPDSRPRGNTVMLWQVQRHLRRRVRACRYPQCLPGINMVRHLRKALLTPPPASPVRRPRPDRRRTDCPLPADPPRLRHRVPCARSSHRRCANRRRRRRSW
ncbi:hypothetical protein BW41_00659 [Sphingomonas sp. RIT328]|nr:hypothetical protein BW41_00659 [Sphingomonas sp. RIT328]